MFQLKVDFNSAFWLVDRIFLELNILEKVRVKPPTGTRHCGSLAALQGSIRPLPLASCFRYSWKSWHWQESCLEDLKCVWNLITESDSFSTPGARVSKRVNSDKEVKLCKRSRNKSAQWNVVLNWHHRVNRLLSVQPASSGMLSQKALQSSSTSESLQLKLTLVWSGVH